MTIYLTYGSSRHTVPELAQLVANLLGVDLEERDSFFRGEYVKGEIGGCELEIQPNAIPGAEYSREDDLYEPDLPNTQTLLLLNAATLDPTITARLNSIDGLYKIREEDID